MGKLNGVAVGLGLLPVLQDEVNCNKCWGVRYLRDQSITGYNDDSCDKSFAWYVEYVLKNMIERRNRLTNLVLSSTPDFLLPFHH